MAGVMVSASTGAMNSVLGKLTALLADEYGHLEGVKRGIRRMRDELSSMNAVLQRLADMEEDQLNVQTKEWRNKVRELSYDIEDCIDRYTHRHSCSGDDAKANFVRKAITKMKQLWEDHRIGDEIKQLKARVIEEGDRRGRYDIDQQLIALPQAVSLDPRAPVLYEQARNLAGIDAPREEIIGLIKAEDEGLKVVSIFGTGGLGKTTLAMEVYNKIDETFDCRAVVSVSRTLDVKKVLRDVLFQINESEYDKSECWDLEQLIPKLRENLKDKRYFVVIDDIWSKEAWEYLKSAFPINRNKSRIITTTRIRDVAKWCCGSFGGHMYEAKPLSEVDSRNLFFRRVFSTEDCPIDLMEVVSEILRKCGGLPLAIISLAGVLSNKNPTVEVWTKIKNSISSAIDKDSSIDKMRRILFLSYFDLPHYLKSCLLYLSVFPEDYAINTRRLVWSWVAEGLIPGQNREYMEQLGESYLYELINRNMIQPIKIGIDGTTVKLCRVHDVILDFIASQAVEENFVSIFSGSGSCYSSLDKMRRLSLQGDISEGLETTKALKELSRLRSFYLFESESISAVSKWFSKCQVLRVFDIEHTTYFEDHHFKHIGCFTQLKYLRISGAVYVLPHEMGMMKHLETLDLRDAYIRIKLPGSIARLQKLVRLFVPKNGAPLPDGIGSLQALEELSYVRLNYVDSVNFIHGLANLTKLRELGISWRTYGSEKEDYHRACISTLSKLLACNLRSLYVAGFPSSGDTASRMFSCGSLLPPLRRLVLSSKIAAIPSEIGSLANLTRLNISVAEVRGLEILASLPALLSLPLWSSSDVPHVRQVISSHGFQRLLKLGFGAVVGVMFQPGAMPKLQVLKLNLPAKWHRQRGHGSPVLGLHHLCGLKSVAVYINCHDADADEVGLFQDDIRGAAVVHPNSPTLEIQRHHQGSESLRNTDLGQQSSKIQISDEKV